MKTNSIEWIKPEHYPLNWITIDLIKAREDRKANHFNRRITNAKWDSDVFRMVFTLF